MPIHLQPLLTGVPYRNGMTWRFQYRWIRVSQQQINFYHSLASITYIWGCMCSTGPFRYRWLKGYIYGSCYYHHQIGSIHLSHCFHIFPWSCAWNVCYIIFCHLLYIDLFSLVLCSLWWVQIVGYVLACRSYSFVCTLHHLITIIVQTLSEDVELIQCLSDIICRVCKQG